MPTFKELNDPFEGYYFMLDKDYLEYLGVKNLESFEKLRDELVNKFRICSLSETNEQCMPMWAYYSNNHQEYCVEYEVSEEIRDITFPVIYTDERECADDIYVEEFFAVQDHNEDETIEPYKNNLLYVSMKNILSYAYKHVSWVHEREYRIIGQKESEYIKLKPKNIYIGINCNIHYKNRIIEYGKKHKGKFGTYIMELDKDSQEFRLISKCVN